MNPLNDFPLILTVKFGRTTGMFFALGDSKLSGSTFIGKK